MATLANVDIPVLLTEPDKLPVTFPFTLAFNAELKLKIPDTIKLPLIVVLPPTAKFAATKELPVTVQTPAT